MYELGISIIYMYNTIKYIMTIELTFVTTHIHMKHTDNKHIHIFNLIKVSCMRANK